MSIGMGLGTQSKIFCPCHLTWTLYSLQSPMSSGKGTRHKKSAMSNATNLLGLLLMAALRLGGAFLLAAALTVLAQCCGLSDAGSWLALGALTAGLFAWSMLPTGE